MLPDCKFGTKWSITKIVWQGMFRRSLLTSHLGHRSENWWTQVFQIFAHLFTFTQYFTKESQTLVSVCKKWFSQDVFEYFPFHNWECSSVFHCTDINCRRLGTGHGGQIHSHKEGDSLVNYQSLTAQYYIANSTYLLYFTYYQI